MPALNTRSLVGDKSLLNRADIHCKEPLMKAAEPRAEYRSDLFGTDDLS